MTARGRVRKWALRVSQAAGAMAAPMLFASVMPASTILPGVTQVTYGPGPSSPRISAPAPVTVHWLVGVRTLPYSSREAELPLRRTEMRAGQRCNFFAAASVYE